jgi:hypothetical protein
MNEIIKKNGIKYGVISGLFSVFYIISLYIVDTSYLSTYGLAYLLCLFF